MPRPSGLLLPHLVLSGAEQMRLDESMLRWAASAPFRVAARTYAWSRPTLSLGRAEPYPEGWNPAAIEAAGVDVVRRPTGGDAVLHDEEVTFAVAASIPGPWAERPRDFARLVADSLADALRGLGLPASVVAPGEENLPAAPPGARLCFARAAAGEVRVLGFKAAGIASRFTHGAALSHASVPLTARHRDAARLRANAAEDEAQVREHARSIGETLGGAPEEGTVRVRLLEALAARFGVVLEPGSLDDLASAAPR
ncbi:MAG TPA: hypothetical protein VE326_14630 [Candidatus Binatia bacterium]|nr:hypothetical protein [Candidatus Binatia bacterium]